MYEKKKNNKQELSVIQECPKREEEEVFYESLIKSIGSILGPFLEIEKLESFIKRIIEFQKDIKCISQAFSEIFNRTSSKMILNIISSIDAALLPNIEKFKQFSLQCAYMLYELMNVVDKNQEEVGKLYFNFMAVLTKKYENILNILNDNKKEIIPTSLIDSYQNNCKILHGIFKESLKRNITAMMFHTFVVQQIDKEKKEQITLEKIEIQESYESLLSRIHTVCMDAVNIIQFTSVEQLTTLKDTIYISIVFIDYLNHFLNSIQYIGYIYNKLDIILDFISVSIIATIEHTKKLEDIEALNKHFDEFALQYTDIVYELMNLACEDKKIVEKKYCLLIKVVTSSYSKILDINRQKTSIEALSKLETNLKKYNNIPYDYQSYQKEKERKKQQELEQILQKKNEELKKQQELEQILQKKNEELKKQGLGQRFKTTREEFEGQIGTQRQRERKQTLQKKNEELKKQQEEKIKKQREALRQQELEQILQKKKEATQELSNSIEKIYKQYMEPLIASKQIAIENNLILSDPIDYIISQFNTISSSIIEGIRNAKTFKNISSLTQNFEDFSLKYTDIVYKWMDLVFDNLETVAEIYAQLIKTKIQIYQALLRMIDINYLTEKTEQEYESLMQIIQIIEESFPNSINEISLKFLWEPKFKESRSLRMLEQLVKILQHHKHEGNLRKLKFQQETAEKEEHQNKYKSSLSNISEMLNTLKHTNKDQLQQSITQLIKLNDPIEDKIIALDTIFDEIKSFIITSIEDTKMFEEKLSLVTMFDQLSSECIHIVDELMILALANQKVQESYHSLMIKIKMQYEKVLPFIDVNFIIFQHSKWTIDICKEKPHTKLLLNNFIKIGAKLNNQQKYEYLMENDMCKILESLVHKENLQKSIKLIKFNKSIDYIISQMNNIFNAISASIIDGIEKTKTYEEMKLLTKNFEDFSLKYTDITYQVIDIICEKKEEEKKICEEKEKEKIYLASKIYSQFLKMTVSTQYEHMWYIIDKMVKQSKFTTDHKQKIDVSLKNTLHKIIDKFLVQKKYELFLDKSCKIRTILEYNQLIQWTKLTHSMYSIDTQQSIDDILKNFSTIFDAFSLQIINSIKHEPTEKHQFGIEFNNYVSAYHDITYELMKKIYTEAEATERHKEYSMRCITKRKQEVLSLLETKPIIKKNSPPSLS